MPPAFGLDFLAPVRSFRNFFGRFGTTSGSIRGVFNAIIPVAVVERYRDDTEGSLFALTMVNITAPFQFPAFAAGSPVDDWELLGVNLGFFAPLAGSSAYFGLNVYTPDATYVPVQTVNPVGFWQPGLNTDWSFTLGSVTGVAGSNTTLPPRLGFYPVESPRTWTTGGGMIFIGPAYSFDPPIRVYRDVTLGFIVDMTMRADTPSFFVTMLYRIRPRTTDGPRTGAP